MRRLTAGHHAGFYAPCRVAELKGRPARSTVCSPVQGFTYGSLPSQQQTQLCANDQKQIKFINQERTNERKQCRPAVRERDTIFPVSHSYWRVIFWCLLPGSAKTSRFVPDAVLVVFLALWCSNRIRPRPPPTSG